LLDKAVEHHNLTPYLSLESLFIKNFNAEVEESIKLRLLIINVALRSLFEVVEDKNAVFLEEYREGTFLAKDDGTEKDKENF